MSGLADFSTHMINDTVETNASSMQNASCNARCPALICAQHSSVTCIDLQNAFSKPKVFVILEAAATYEITLHLSIP